LETIREFGQEQLAVNGEADAVAARHLAYFLALAERADHALRGREQLVWLDRLETEHDNLRAALAWALATPASHAEAVRLARRLHWFWHLRGHLGEGRRLIDATLAQSGASDDTADRVIAGAGAGFLALLQGDYAEAHAHLNPAIALARAEGEDQGLALALIALGLLTLLHTGDLAGARAACLESEAVFRAIDGRWGLAFSLHTLGLVDIADRQLDDARVRLDEGLAIARTLGDRWLLARLLHCSGEVARGMGDFIRAKAWFAEVVALYGELGHPSTSLSVLYHLGWVAMCEGDRAAAGTWLAAALKQGAKLGDKRTIAQCLAALAELAGTPQDAARLAGAAAALLEEMGASMWSTDGDRHERFLATLRAAFGEPAFVRAYEQGQRLPVDEAVALGLSFIAGGDDEPPMTALQEPAPPTAAPGRQSSLDLAPFGAALSRREWEVAELIRQGYSNREIGDLLSISTGTAERHVANIFAKLGFHTRAQVAAWIVAHQPGEPTSP
jgi:non-specific serine/threonine protein kinase